MEYCENKKITQLGKMLKNEENILWKMFSTKQIGPSKNLVFYFLFCTLVIVWDSECVSYCLIAKKVEGKEELGRKKTIWHIYFYRFKILTFKV